MNKSAFFRIFMVAAGLVALSNNALAVIKLGDGSASGQWYDPNRNGEGFYVEEIGEGDNLQLGIAMYSFDENGNQLWFNGAAPVKPGDIGAVVTVIQVEGPMWGSGFDPADAVITEFGTVTVQFTSCTTALFSVESNIPELEDFEFTGLRLTTVTGTSCVDELYQDPDAGITSGLWTGVPGGCFVVNEEGTAIVESDLCDDGKALSAEVPGIEININGRPNPQTCQANVICEGAWQISNDNAGGTPTVSCTAGAGSAATIFFRSATQADVQAVQGGLGSNALCIGTFTASP